MALITKPNTFTAGATIIAAEHNDNLDTIYSEFNGNIDNANIKSSAAIVDTKLAQITTIGKVSTTALVIASQAQGDILYAASGTTWGRLAAGTDGQCLTTQGAAANPTFAGMTTQGDVEYHSGTDRARLAAGTAGQALTTGGAGANPAFAGMTTQGDIEYHNGTTRTRLAPGTSGQFLKTNGAGANPAWASNGVKELLFFNVLMALSTDRYLGPSAAATTDDGASIILPYAGTLTALYSRTDDANANTIVIVVYKNGSSTLMTATHADGVAGQVSDVTNTISIAAGDRISVRVTNNRAANLNARITIHFTPS